MVENNIHKSFIFICGSKIDLMILYFVGNSDGKFIAYARSSVQSHQ